MWARQLSAVDLQSLAQMYSQGRDLIWLDSSLSKSHRFARYSYLCIDPIESLPASSKIHDLRHTLNRYEVGCIDHGPPFQGGLVGFFEYEFSDLGTIENCDHDRENCHFRLYDTVIAVDHHADLLWIISSGLKRNSGESCMATAQKRIKAIELDIKNLPKPVSPPVNLIWHCKITKPDYLKAVHQILEFIRQGDIYQANYSQIFSATIPQNSDIFHIYLSTRKSNPSPFGAYGIFGDQGICCTSPERLVMVDTHGLVEARPIKGTIKRSTDPLTDQDLRNKLLSSKKDRAENIMIVDLLRNDLSKVCKPHTVHVKKICELESYKGLHQLTSSVQGQIMEDQDAFDLLSAVFPGGSVTGAPKHRAMEIIHQLERHPRRIFCGSLGYFGFNGAADFNIMIRTIQFKGAQARLDVGGGITSMSDPEEEYQECLLKAQKIIDGTGKVIAQ